MNVTVPFLPLTTHCLDLFLDQPFHSCFNSMVRSAGYHMDFADYSTGPDCAMSGYMLTDLTYGQVSATFASCGPTVSKRPWEVRGRLWDQGNGKMD